MKALILAGGKGSRLWPLSRDLYPKQLLSLGGDLSFLQETVRRVAQTVAPQDIFIVTSSFHYEEVLNQAASLFPELRNHIIPEPCGRNTAPAIALGLKFATERASIPSQEVFFVCPSDHVIQEEGLFASCLQQACRLAKKGHLVTFGIPPTKAETGYGYVQLGETLGQGLGFKALRFVEKPNLATAEEYVKSGCYLWNSGMFCFSADTLFQAIERHCPSLHALSSGTYQALLDSFPQLPDVSIDYAVMEKSDCLAIIPLPVPWSDIGSWDSLYDIWEKDASHNVKRGNVLEWGTSHSLLIGEKRLVAAIGMQDCIVVETSDAVVVAKRGTSQHVKEIVTFLRSQDRKEVKSPSMRHFPWGSFTTLEEAPGYCVRKVCLLPRAIIKTHAHSQHIEHFTVLKGQGKTTLQSDVYSLKAGESLSVPLAASHDLENPCDEPLEILEIHHDAEAVASEKAHHPKEMT